MVGEIFEYYEMAQITFKYSINVGKNFEHKYSKIIQIELKLSTVVGENFEY